MPKPDFSGEWILNRLACTLSPGADAIQRAEARIDHRDPSFKYSAEFVSETGAVKVEYELQTDGSEVRSTHEGTTTVSSLRWDETALISAWGIQHAGGEMTISFRHELIDDGRRLRSVEELRGSGRRQDNTWIFDRR